MATSDARLPEEGAWGKRGKWSDATGSLTITSAMATFQRMDRNHHELSDLARRAADAVGFGHVSDVEVINGHDSSDQPALFFSFLVDQNRDLDRARAALVRTRLSQRLRDELLKNRDSRYPFIRVFTDRDWERRERAQLG